MLRRGDGTDDDAIPFLQRAGEWAAALSPSSIPEPTRRAAEAQLLSTLGAARWTCQLPIADRIAASVRSEASTATGATSRDDVTFLAGGSLPPRDAAYGNAVLSMALDYDDTVLGAHAGHSAVFVPVAYAESTGASGEHLLVAVIAATEVAARLGSAAAVGPFRGQQTAYVHAAAAAVGRGVIEGDDGDTITDALTLALARPPWPLDAAFFTDAKLTTAAEPVERGCRALAEARVGADTNRGLVEADGGFLDAFADHPLPEFLGGLGDRWHTRAVTVKPVPGCAYVTAPVEAALDARRQLRGRDQVRLDHVRVEGSLFMTEVDALAGAYVDGPDSSLAALNFSVPYNVAVALRVGEHTPREFLPERIHDESVWALADRIEVAHDPEFTVAALDSEVPLGAMLRRIGPAVIPYAASTVGPKTALRHLPSLLRFVRRRPLPEALDGAEKRMGARVTLELADGSTVSATCAHPTGFAGRPLAEIRGTARQKLRQALTAGGRPESDARALAGEVATIADATVVTLEDLAEEPR